VEVLKVEELRRKLGKLKLRCTDSKAVLHLSPST